MSVAELELEGDTFIVLTLQFIVGKNRRIKYLNL